ncbi:M48 family metallopeptidase [Fulvivirga maritima]|uniref:M48 family metallopeptidase n=1 Tax=Fulvivirga maritima TaxID=2904247 RepID=UPI001F35C812|nr:M48 family metallopeptidase [Fulvivirga maritima]UII26957.1 M48 family metallopeptidase [Fulvivirga maritima]
MAPNIILYIILGIITIDFAVDQLLDYLNHKSKRVDLPEEIASFYDEEKYKKSQEYQKVSGRFSFITSSFSFIISFLMLSLGGFGYIDQLLRPYFENEIWLALANFGVLYVVSDVINIPFQWYSTFVIEERFGFNKTTPKTFVLDKIKGYALSAVLGVVLVGALLYLILNIGENFWLYFWLVASVFILFVNMFYTSLILPLFNKLTPLEDGELKSAIQAYSEKIAFPLDSIYVIDGSKRSNKANAFFSGLGKKKKIVLYDTLINNHTTEELVAVLAHEVGHFKKKHIIYGFAISIMQIGVMLFVMSTMIYNENLSLALGAEQMGVHLNLLAFGLLYSPISTLLGIAMNIFSRKNEYEADAYARETYDGDALATALKKLSVDNLSNLYPHPAYVFVNYSHPPLLARLAAIKNEK